MIQISDKLIFFFVICSSFIKDLNSSFMIADDKKSECVGSIILNNNSSLTIRSTVPEMNLKVWTVRMEGCGCYRLHQRTRGRGRSLRIFQQGITMVTMGRVRSIVTEQCFGGDNRIALYGKHTQVYSDSTVKRITTVTIPAQTTLRTPVTTTLTTT